MPVQQHLIALEAKSRAEMRAPARGSVSGKINHLVDLRGIGVVGGRKLMHEVFYRAFEIVLRVGSFFGSGPNSAYDSGTSHRDQGISKAGNRRARTLAVEELAWLWLRYQPESELSRWFYARARSSQGPYPAHCHRGARPQADGRLVALYHHWRSPHRRRKPPEHLNGRAQ